MQPHSLVVSADKEDETLFAACVRAQVQTMLAGICGRFRVELAECMGGEAGVLDRQISNFTLSVDGGLFMHFHDRAQARTLLETTVAHGGIRLSGLSLRSA